MEKSRRIIVPRMDLLSLGPLFLPELSPFASTLLPSPPPPGLAGRSCKIHSSWEKFRPRQYLAIRRRRVLLLRNLMKPSRVFSNRPTSIISTLLSPRNLRNVDTSRLVRENLFPPQFRPPLHPLILYISRIYSHDPLHVINKQELRSVKAKHIKQELPERNICLETRARCCTKRSSTYLPFLRNIIFYAQRQPSRALYPPFYFHPPLVRSTPNYRVESIKKKIQPRHWLAGP